jgi:hypothetical protein
VIARIVAASIAAAAFAAQAAETVAFVADIHGNATIEDDGKLNFLAELPAGTRLLLGTGATVTVTYVSSGTEFTMKGRGEFLVSQTEVKAERGAAPGKRAVNVLADPAVISKIARTANASLRMRGLGAPPAGTVVLTSLPPEAIAKAEKSRKAARTFSDRVMHALLLQDLGATQDAKEAWASLARERPDLPELGVLSR